MTPKTDWFPEPTEWLELAATRVREHAEIMGLDPCADKDAMAVQPTGSRTVPTPQTSPSPVTVLATRRRRP